VRGASGRAADLIQASLDTRPARRNPSEQISCRQAVFPPRTVACARLSGWIQNQKKRKERKRMNKSELIEAVAADTGLTKVDSALVLESVLGTVSNTLKKGDDVIITGFGKFSVVKRAARQGVNPRTGERVKIKASKAPKFSAGATLKQAVSGKKK
jgi:DNA-binding protein HU-beta